jgi:hypothetical protein
MRIPFACSIAVAAFAALSCSSASKEQGGSDDDSGAGEENEASGGKASSAAGAGGRGGNGAGNGSTAGFPGISGASTGAGGSLATGGNPSPPGAGGSEDAGNAGDGAAGGGGAAESPFACTAPCELPLGPSDNLPGKSAVVLYDFETHTGTVTNDPEANAASQWVVGFSLDDDPQRGYRSWSTSSWWFAYTEPLEYVDGTYSIRPDVEITSQLVNPATSQILRVVYSFGDQSVRVHAIGVPDCDAATSGACASPGDCATVEGGTLRARTEKCSAGCNGSTTCTATCLSGAGDVSLACSTCYADLLACVTAGCSSACPGTGDSTCMSCETEHDCHLAYMACSGLDYMPRGTLTWPAVQLAR